MQRRPPLPEPVYRAMVVLAINIGWDRWAGNTVISFEGCSRPGEPLRGIRSDLLLPSGMSLGDEDCISLKVRKPKSGRRGRGIVQHFKENRAFLLSATVVQGYPVGRPHIYISRGWGCWAAFAWTISLLLCFLMKWCLAHSCVVQSIAKLGSYERSLHFSSVVL